MKEKALHFIEANAPLPDLGAAFFVENCKDRISGKRANYENIVAFLPTRAAARTLKDTIISTLIKKGVTNILGLKICTYEDFLSNFSDLKNAISKIENYSIWLSIILNCDFNLINALLPETENISRKEVLHIAKEIIFLQKKLADDLISINAAKDKFSDSLDYKRWQDLAFLEELYLHKIKDLGRISQLESTLSAIENAKKSPIEKLLIIGNPDISASLKFFVDEFTKAGKNVDIAIFAKENEKEFFDDFGAPKDLEYSNKELDIKEKNIFLCASPKDEAILVKNLAENYGAQASKIIGIACEQKENAEIFKDTIESENLKPTLAEGEKLSQTIFFDLLKNIKAFLEKDSFENFSNLTRNFFIINYIKSHTHSIEGIQGCLDEIKKKTACKDISSVKFLLEKSDEGRLLKEIIEQIESINLENLEEKILKFCKNINCEKEQDAIELFKESISSILTINENFYIAFNLDEVFTILFETLEATTLKTEIEKNSILLQDWMEIFWSKKAHILLCDMNDGIVPLRDNNGLFLNDSIRKTLSMRTQLARQARDAYMLECLAKSRLASSYAISILVSQRKNGGDPLVPSRILFQTKKEDIAKRVNFLFKESASKSEENDNALDWKLEITAKAFEGNYSVSRFNSYLNSPWLFYLQNVLKMEIVDVEKEELDPADFGNLYHKILENFGKSEIKDSINSEQINEFFLKELDKILLKNFANKARVQIKIQLEDLKSRLYNTAIQQVEHRKQGWKIIHVEEKFKNYKLGEGVLLNGVFDRIDYHEEKGFLIIDYKTKNKADSNIVEKSHRIEKKDSSVIWSNLQIPIYLEVFKNLDLNTDKNAELNAAYFCATKDAASTKFYYWQDAEIYIEEAKNIALDLAEKIKNKEFFTFEKEDKYGNFNSVFKLDFDLIKDNIEVRSEK